MNSRINIDSQWFCGLVKEFPQSAEQLGALADHLTSKQERLAALVRYCAAHPELNMMRMYAEYNAALDAVALEPSREVEPEVSDEGAKELPPRQRAARTKRIRTRRAILDVAEELILTGRTWRRDELTILAGVGVATLYWHFATNNQLLVATYDHILNKA